MRQSCKHAERPPQRCLGLASSVHASHMDSSSAASTGEHSPGEIGLSSAIVSSLVVKRVVLPLLAQLASCALPSPMPVGADSPSKLLFDKMSDMGASRSSPSSSSVTVTLLG